MKAYKCDRCGKLYTGVEYDYIKEELKKYKIEENRYPYPDKTLDLCTSCRISLNRWLRSKNND